MVGAAQRVLGEVGEPALDPRRLHSSIANRPPVEHEAEWRRNGSHPNTQSSPGVLFTLNAAGEYGPSGVVSDRRPGGNDTLTRRTT